ncbi:hypothetical protein NAPIS_ORF00014 [Vairimorpha apis BRL 01]|uniref:Uncharacterized protein n=1 Tax=Vairimorpha apis BRL 01 TaxID=1037528 RepID=T0MH16_9MICR|nr:hypothetical protein NAPIS_ORF00014 [Vairimorpha apis BRL 01]
MTKTVLKTRTKSVKNIKKTPQSKVDKNVSVSTTVCLDDEGEDDDNVDDVECEQECSCEDEKSCTNPCERIKCVVIEV